MLFGLWNTGATFQLLMKTVLWELKGKICLIFKDIIVFSKTLLQYLRDLEVFQKLHQAHLTLKIKKCCLFHIRFYLSWSCGIRQGSGSWPSWGWGCHHLSSSHRLEKCAEILGDGWGDHKFIQRLEDIVALQTTWRKKGVPWVLPL